MKKRLLALSVSSAISSQAHAFQFETPDDWNIRWDNTFKANVVSRVAKQDKDVYTIQGASQSNPDDTNGWWLADDSDLSVDRSNLGLVSTRLDVLSELDVVFRRDFGFRVSGSAWYDPQYEDSDHPEDRIYTWASPSVDPGEYTDEAKDLHYLGGELLDAFVFANVEIGDTILGVRAGRHTIYWGNSLLSLGAVSGIGGAMATLDFAKALSVPGTEAKELFMPSNKISAVFQPTNNLTLNAYYSLEHQRYRVPETGTYFSPAEGLSDNTEFITLPPGDPGDEFRTGFKGYGDEDSDDEFGFNLQYFIEPWGLETSFIYLNYVDKNLHGLHAGFDAGQLANVLADSDNPAAGLAQVLLGGWNASCADGSIACPNDPVINPNRGTIQYGKARWLFKEDIDLFGISLNKEIAGVSVGADIVFRQDTGLAPSLGAGLQRVYGADDVLDAETVQSVLGLGYIEGDFFDYDSDNYLGPVGDVWTVVLNGIGFLQNNGFWEGGAWILETTFQMLDECTENCQLLDDEVEEEEVVATVEGVFKPTWYQVRPGWDLSVPMSISYTLNGSTKSPFTFGGDEERGNGSVGVEVLINEIWTVNAKYNVFFGPARAGIGGLLKDRDNISLTVKRTF